MDGRIGLLGVPLMGLLLFLSAATVSAKAWKDITPGVSTRDEVLEKFGEPFREYSRGGRLSNAVNYQGDQAIADTRDVSFFFDKNDLLFRIDVFPEFKINTKQVKKIFGMDYLEGITKKGYILFNYWREGMVVFFKKEKDIVHSFMFTEPKGVPKGGKKK